MDSGLPQEARAPFAPAAAALQLWRDWRAKRRPVVLRPYVDLHSRWRLAARFLLPAGLGLFCLIYGFFFALTAPYLIVPMSAPVVLLALLSIWALPERSHAPTRAMEFCFSALLISLALWPNYLALTLPGLPWITMIRLTAFPMAFFLLVSLSTSPQFRARIAEAAAGAPLLFTCLLIFSVNCFISLPLSKGIGDSLNKLILQQLNWVGVFLVALYIFRQPGRAERYAGLLLLIAIPVAAVGLLEFQGEHVPWAGHVPSFLRVEDPAVQRALAGAVRSATGLYRAKATFSTALGLAEFLALMTPFAIHWAVGRYPFAVKVAGFLLIPALYVVIRTTDARLGVVGFIISVAVYVLIWSLVRWRRRIGDLFAAALVYAYPAAFIVLLGASMFVHKIHVLIFGGGAQSASDFARQRQWDMTWPALFKNPIGYGSGQAGVSLGYGAGDFIAVDSYYIDMALSYGALGVTLYVGMFAIAIGTIVRALLTYTEHDDREFSLLIPIATCLTAFLVIRSVFAQAEIHPMIFAILGMAVCLIARAKSESAAQREYGQGYLKHSDTRSHQRSPARAPLGTVSVLAIAIGASVALWIFAGLKAATN